MNKLGISGFVFAEFFLVCLIVTKGGLLVPRVGVTYQNATRPVAAQRHGNAAVGSYDPDALNAAPVKKWMANFFASIPALYREMLVAVREYQELMERIDELEKQHDVDVGTIEELTKKVADLLVQHDRDAKLIKELAGEANQLAAKVRRVQIESAALKAENAELKDECGSLKSTVEMLQANVINLEEQHGKDLQLIAGLKKEIDGLKAKIEEFGTTISELTAQHKQLEETIKQLGSDKRKLVIENGKLKEQNDVLTSRNKRLSAEAQRLTGKLDRTDPSLLGLKSRRGNEGTLGKVVVLIDASYSMVENTGAGHQGWRDTVKPLIVEWLRGLRVDEYAIIAFNDPGKYVALPKLLPGGRPGGYVRPREAELGAFLDSEIKPAGETDTAGALRLAYAYKPDAILLFSDGQPEYKGGGDVITETLQLVKRNSATAASRIPVNVVAVGDYSGGIDEKPNGTSGGNEMDQRKQVVFLAFMRRLAYLSGGGFMGK